MTSERTERVPLSPADYAKMVRRCAMRIQQGVPLRDLERSYSRQQIADAKEMAEKGKKKQS